LIVRSMDSARPAEVVVLKGEHDVCVTTFCLTSQVVGLALDAEPVLRVVSADAGVDGCLHGTYRIPLVGEADLARLGEPGAAADQPGTGDAVMWRAKGRPERGRRALAQGAAKGKNTAPP